MLFDEIFEFSLRFDVVDPALKQIENALKGFRIVIAVLRYLVDDSRTLKQYVFLNCLLVLQ